MPMSIRLFVYGSLLRGSAEHEEYCSGAAAYAEASVEARLYDLPEGYPSIVVPEPSILAIATFDPLEDARLQLTVAPAPPAPAWGDWDTVHGALITLSDAATLLPRIDEYEGCNADSDALYRRVLITVETADGLQTAWTYAQSSVDHGRRILSGRWLPISRPA
ncbi:MAG: gamma-glutamylcyclotransferase [Candidatus Hydrogenedens sp.]|nr:gamma-glutamylcyclotransferase [Candidatus Hydrogenedens sp.]